jgi:hypothetical protein
MGVMTEDRWERWLREAAQDYHRPPETPREELWRRIAAARGARRRAVALRPWLRWGVGIAALLALGIGIGRWTARAPLPPSLAAGSRGTPSDPVTLPYRLVAAQYLTRTEALLTGFRAEARAGQLDARFATQARDLLATTRLILDSPAAADARLKGLLDDLEVVLAQIAQLSATGAPDDLQLINQGLEQRGVLLRLEAANPAGSGPVHTQGVL